MGKGLCGKAMHENPAKLELSAVYCAVQSHNYEQKNRINNKETTFFTF
jgi:hypothetical protein